MGKAFTNQIAIIIMAEINTTIGVTFPDLIHLNDSEYPGVTKRMLVFGL